MSDDNLFTNGRVKRIMVATMELDDESLRLLSGVCDDESELDPTVISAVKTRELSVRKRRKPGKNKPRKTMLPIASIGGPPERIELLVRWHYTLALRQREGQVSTASVARILRTLETEINNLCSTIVDNAPIKNILRTKKSGHSLDELQRAAQALIELLTPVANGQPPGREEQAALGAALKAFGLTPREAWIPVLVREIERERRTMLGSVSLNTERDSVEHRARALMERVRNQLRAELPQHVTVASVSHILKTYAFHSGGGRRDAVTGRRRAIEILRSGRHH